MVICLIKTTEDYPEFDFDRTEIAGTKKLESENEKYAKHLRQQ